MLKQAYYVGQDAALSELEKDAGFKNMLKNTAITAGLMIPPAIGGVVGGGKGMNYMAKAPIEVLNKLNHAAPKVDSAAYYAQKAPEVKTMVGEQGWNNWLKEIEVPEASRAAMAKQITKETNLPLYMPVTKSIHAPSSSPESFLAHELGHSKLEHPGNNIINIMSGNTLKNEQAAWDYARRFGGGGVVDPKLEQAALETYRQGQFGARAGGAAGATGGGLLSLLAALKMARRKRTM